MIIAIFNNLPALVLGLVYTYSVFKVGRWFERWRNRRPQEF